MSILWKGDFSTGDLTQWDGSESVDKATRLTVVPAPLRTDGSKALKAMVQSTDIVQNGVRNEVYLEGLTPKVLAPLGSERWYKWSTLFPTDFPVSTDWQVSTQFHQSYLANGTTVGVTPPLVFALDGKDNFQFISSTAADVPTNLYSKPLVRGAWMDLMLHVLWSADPKVGFVELMLNGQLVVPKTFVATVFAGLVSLSTGPNYLKQGLYRARTILPPATVYHQGAAMADSAADFWSAPVVVPPPTPAPPAPTTFNLQDSTGAWWTFTIGRKP